MSDRYAELPTGNSNWSSVNTWKATTDGATGASVPTSADNVYINADSCDAGATLTVDATANCLTMDWTGATNTPTFSRPTGTGVLSISGSVTFIADMTLSLYSAPDVNITGTTDTTLTLNGVTCVGGANWRIDKTGKFTVTDNISSSAFGQFTLAKGELVLASTTYNLKGLYLVGADAKTLTIGSVTISVGNTGINNTGSNITVTANTATINISGTGALAGGSVDWNGATFNLTGSAHTVSGAFTCANLTRHPTTHANTDTLTMTSGTTVTVTDTFTVDGGARATQLLVQSSTLGTAATIHATTWTVSNADFMDITADTHLQDFSAQTDVGDCGGNTGITFPAGDAQTSKNTDNWSLASGWTGTVADRIPLPQDDVTCSHSKTVDMPRIGKSITFTGTPTITQSNDMSVYGSLTFSSGMSYTSNSKTVFFRGRSNYSVTLYNKGMGFLRFESVSGYYTFIGDYTSSAWSSFGLYSGTLDISNCTLTFTASGTDTYPFVASGGTLVTTNSTIVFSRTVNTNVFFAGGGKTYNNVTVQGTGNYALTITGSDAFHLLKIDASQAPKTVKFTDGTTTSVGDLIRDTNGTNIITLTGTSTGGWNIVKTGTGVVNLDYMNISYSQAS